jgi:hypothetical protein
MRLVDDLHEQELLEQVLEASKPPLPPGCAGLPYLLATPFRYASPWGSRFRSADEPGAWYGADDPQTVAAELAYWRWRFFTDSDGLRDQQLVTEHTFFLATFQGRELDLTVPPWDERRASWRTRRTTGVPGLARAVRRRQPPAASAIRYESARREAACARSSSIPRACASTIPMRSRPGSARRPSSGCCWCMGRTGWSSAGGWRGGSWLNGLNLIDASAIILHNAHRIYYT